MKALPKLLWCDVETTGLDKFVILEVALLATDEYLRTEECICLQLPVKAVDPIDQERLLNAGLATPSGLALHRDNGLLELCAAVKTPEEQVWRELEDFAGKFQGRPMAGSSVHADRRFLGRYRPSLLSLFHYRNFDVRTLRMFFGLEKESVQVDHRAGADLAADLRDTRALRDEYLD